MEIFGTARREEWREYLEKHHKTSEEIWFLFPTTAAEEDSITYNDAVEEALCFGWIDSTNRKLDDLHCIRRFTPRRKGSSYSRPNIERMIWLNERGMGQIQQFLRTVQKDSHLVYRCCQETSRRVQKAS